MSGLLRRASGPDEAGRQGLARVLAEPTFEVIPLKNVREQAAALPRGATVSITAITGRASRRAHSWPNARSRELEAIIPRQAVVPEAASP